MKLKKKIGLEEKEGQEDEINSFKAPEVQKRK